MGQDENIQYSVSFVLDGKNNKVMFKSKEGKDSYIGFERHFCLKELEAYGGSMNVTDRKALRIELEKKRMAFAIHSGFQEVGKTGIWNRVVRDDAKELA